LAQEKVVVTQQRDKIQKDFDSSVRVIRDKEGIIDVGTTLHASNFNIIGLDERNGGKEKETSKAKKVDKLRITFDIDENMITPSGTKELYIIITAPDGKPIAVDDMGSGRFNTRDGEEKYLHRRLTSIILKINGKQSVSTGSNLPISVLEIIRLKYTTMDLKSAKVTGHLKKAACSDKINS
jgi:hypothetical protein